MTSRRKPLKRLPMERRLELFHRDQLRSARATVLRDAEAFGDIIFAIEALGSALTGERANLYQYSYALLDLASRSPIADGHATNGSTYEPTVPTLIELVRDGRNEAFHEGAYARHLASHAVALALTLEDALTSPEPHELQHTTQVGDFMVTSPTTVDYWHPLGHVRRLMLLNSFSYIPLLLLEEGSSSWKLISDFSLAQVLRVSPNKQERRRRADLSIEEAVEKHGLLLTEACCVLAKDEPAAVLDKSEGKPALVFHSGRLVGIVTPFDLL